MVVANAAAAHTGADEQAPASDVRPSKLQPEVVLRVGLRQAEVPIT